ncbi:hypothetical protein [Cryobacterium sp. Y29]|uniref:hypothetical protein n=1 Tax=Cryobacterium sp. Y29 TaxID=2048285 RepID=UPI000CE52F55|nr:hypothetical protein [Cryobacterium sp. Y29]
MIKSRRWIASSWPPQIGFASGGIGGIDAQASAVDQCAFPERLVELDNYRDGIITLAIGRVAAERRNVNPDRDLL